MNTSSTSNEKFDALLGGPLTGTVDDLIDELEALAPDVDVAVLIAAVRVFRHYSEGRRRMIKALDSRDHLKVVEFAKGHDYLLACEATSALTDRADLEDVRRNAECVDAKFVALDKLTGGDDSVTFGELLDQVADIVGD